MKDIIVEFHQVSTNRTRSMQEVIHYGGDVFNGNCWIFDLTVGLSFVFNLKNPGTFSNFSFLYNTGQKIGFYLGIGVSVTTHSHSWSSDQSTRDPRLEKERPLNEGPQIRRNQSTWEDSGWGLVCRWYEGATNQRGMRFQPGEDRKQPGAVAAITRAATNQRGIFMHCS